MISKHTTAGPSWRHRAHTESTDVRVELKRNDLGVLELHVFDSHGGYWFDLFVLCDELVEQSKNLK